MIDEETVAKNVLRLARLDGMVRSFEGIYRGMDDRDDGALCLALVIGQGTSSFGITVSQNALVAAILEDWADERND